MVTWRQALTTPAWETTFTVSIGAEGTENDVAPGFAVAGLVADTHKSYVQVCHSGAERPAAARAVVTGFLLRLL